MIKVTENALSALSKAFGTRPDELQFLGGGREDSDGIAYTYDAHGRKMVLKILAVPEKDTTSLHRLETRIRFANYLGNGGISVSSPVRNDAGNLFEVFPDAQHIFVAYNMHYAEGKDPKSEELTPEVAYNWGRLTGKSHKLTKSFTASLSPDQKFGWQDEINSFTGLCRDADVKNTWMSMGFSYTATVDIGLSPVKKMGSRLSLPWNCSYQSITDIISA
jgi:Ser/Thr protein kinase RdoA (MazF antagonist)